MYSFNNPLKFYDPSGLAAEVVTIAPEYYAKFIAQVCSGLDLNGLSNLYKGSEIDLETDFLDNLFNNLFDSKGGGTIQRLSATKEQIAEVITLAVKIKLAKYMTKIYNIG